MEQSARLPAFPLILLGAMSALLIASAWNDSAIFDEVAHVAAGYSYVTEFDARLNPEHPPLVKALAALPLLFRRDIAFPIDTAAWESGIDGRQWEQGRIFLYDSGNDPDAILFWMRLPVIGLAVLLGWLLWRWMRTRYGSAAAGVALLLFAAFPTVLVHARFVTTDVGATLGFFVALVSFIRVLEQPSRRNIVFAGIAFGIAQTVKYSLFLLVPAYLIIAVPFALAHTNFPIAERLRLLGRSLARIAAIGAVGLAVIWLVFLPVVWNYPAEKNIADARAIIGGFRIPALRDLDLFLIETPGLRPIGQYLFGLMMITQRAAGGNTQYFLGEISSQGTPLYFPILYLLKEPIAYHLLSLIALIAGLRRMTAAGMRPWRRISGWIRGHPAEFSLGTFVVFYWAYSIAQPLNIGVRHVLPAYPFLFALIGRELSLWLRPAVEPNPPTWLAWFFGALRAYLGAVPRALAVVALLALAWVSSLLAFPHYLSYFNELGGGTDGGYRIATDSNYDWGQDLKRLARFAEEYGIEKIAVDYFGGGSPSYYLGEKFEPWWSSRGYPEGGGWLAVSANVLMGAYGEIGSGFARKPEDSYEWLKPFRPVARAGKSIFIYRLPEKSPEFSPN